MPTNTPYFDSYEKTRQEQELYKIKLSVREALREALHNANIQITHADIEISLYGTKIREKVKVFDTYYD
jgi:L-lactate utilization protein LutC